MTFFHFINQERKCLLILLTITLSRLIYVMVYVALNLYFDWVDVGNQFSASRLAFNSELNVQRGYCSVTRRLEYLSIFEHFHQ